ncbi:MAG TPA: M56 family metallopeptidase, partial [Xanthomonadales bacterium]|nr:M56 family metallopeptidase [Xanthomonadales bacterium]
MFAIDLLLNNTLISALGWTLVHFLWQGCLIALIYWLICALAPRHAASLRYWTGLAGLLLSLLAVLLTFALSYSPEARFETAPATATAVNPFLVLSGHFPNTLALLETGIEPALPWVVLLWLLGVICFSVRTLRDWIGVRRLLQEGIVSTELQLQIALETLKSLMNVQLPVRLLASTRVAVPLAIGWLRPVILIPVSVLARLPQDQLEMILAHELGHIRRGDYAFNLLQVILETLLFYHPAIAWMSQRVREEREHRCDDLVVRFCGKPATYARALTNLEVMRSPVLAPAIAATGGNLLARIRLIINKELPGKGSSLTQFALVATAGIFVAFGAQQGFSLSTELN